MLLLSVTLFIGMLTGCNTNETNKVKLGYVNWAEGIAMTNLAAAILEDEMGYEVELTLADVGPIFTSVASGNTDAFLDVWLPVTHKDYLDQYGDDLVLLEPSNENARIGLVVPSYVDFDSIEDLNANKADFDGKIIGIDSGAGIMSTTETAIDDYELEFDLVTGSGPAMTAALKNAIDSNESIVVTGWSPHWKFARWDLKFLTDPLNIYGEKESINIITRKDLSEDMPDVAEFLSNLKFTDTELADLMGAIEDSDKETLEAARDWMIANPESVAKWLPSE